MACGINKEVVGYIGNLHVEAVDGDAGGGSDGDSVIGTVGIDDDDAAAVLELSSTRC